MADSGLAQSIAIKSITNDFVDKMLAGSNRTNEAVAGVVAGLYFIFLVMSIINFSREKQRLHFLIIAFCCIRIVTFSVRAYMQKNLTQNWAIVYEAFFCGGFVFLVKALIILLSSWTMPTNVAPKDKRGFSLGILRSQGIGVERILSVSLMIGAVCIIIGADIAYTNDSTVKEYNKGLSLMKAGYTIFLFVITIFCFMVITGPIFNRLSFGRPRHLKSASMLVLALLVAGLCLECKSVYQVIAVYTNPSLTFKNKLFYPLEVLTELVVLCIVCFPGFIKHMIAGSHAYPETDSAMKTGGLLPRRKPTGGNNISPTSLPPVTHAADTGELAEV